MDEIKKKNYYLFRMRNKRNGIVDVHGNGTVNTPASVPCTELWSSRKTCIHHVLNVYRPYSLWDVWRPEILPNRHVIPTLKIAFFHIFFGFFLRLVLKNYVSYMVQTNYL